MLIFVRIPNSELRWLTMYPCLIWGKMNCLRLSGSRLHRYRPYRSTFFTRYRSYRSTVYTRYRPYILQFIPDTGLTGNTLYQIQALQVILYTRYRPYRSYFIPDTGLTGHTLYQIQVLQVVLISLEWPVSNYSHYINCVFFDSLFRWCYLVEESLDV